MRISIIKILISAGMLIAITACSETKEVYFETLNDAKKQGAIERGWLPEVLPRSSHEIFGRHDTGANATWLRFKFSKNDIYNMAAQAEEMKPDDIKALYFPSISAAWWPDDLKRKLVDGSSGLKLYKYDRIIKYGDANQKIIQAYFVIDWNSDVAYYWEKEH